MQTIFYDYDAGQITINVHMYNNHGIPFNRGREDNRKTTKYKKKTIKII